MIKHDFSFLILDYFRNFPNYHTKYFWDLTYAMLYACWYQDLLGDVSDIDLPSMTFAAALHDIGKSSLPRSIVEASSELSPLERKTMETHTVRGALILSSVDLPLFRESRIYQYGYEICLHHHERWDGSGYPDGLKGDEIPPYVQAVSLVDCYDALRSARAYWPSFSHHQAMKLIQSGNCGIFNPKMLDCFSSFIDTVDKELYSEAIPT